MPKRYVCGVAFSRKSTTSVSRASLSDTNSSAVSLNAAISIRYSFLLCIATPETFNDSLLALEMDYQYTRTDGLTGRFTASKYTNVGQFGGEKAGENSPPTLRRKFSCLTPATLSERPPLQCQVYFYEEHMRMRI